MTERKDTLSDGRGSLLIQVVVVLVLFALLGAAMVAIFTASIHSTGTPNFSRRATYLAESGIRYAKSELTNAAYNNRYSKIQELNLINRFTVDGSGSFSLKVLGLWFKNPDATYPGGQNVAAGGSLFLYAPTLNVPDDFSFPSGAYIINQNNVYDTSPVSGVAEVASYAKISDNVIKLVLNDEFYLGADERVYPAVAPPSGIGSQSISRGRSIYVASGAEDLLPERSGVVVINEKSYLYERRLEDVALGRVELRGLLEPVGAAGGFPATLGQNDYVILSPTRKNLWLNCTGSATRAQVTSLVASNTFFRSSTDKDWLLDNAPYERESPDEAKAAKAHYTFDEPADLGRDETGAHPAVVTEGVTSAAGVVGRGIALGGGHLEVADSPELEMSIGDKVSVAAWVMKNTAQDAMDWVAVVQKSDFSYNLQLEDGNHPVFTIWDFPERREDEFHWKAARARNPDNTQFTMENNVWYYLVGTFDAADPGEVREVYSLDPDTQGEEKGNDHRRCILEADDLVDFSGQQIRVRFEADPFNELNIDLVYIGERVAGTYDIKSSPGKVKLTFDNGSDTVNIPAGQSRWSDWVNFPTDGTRDLVVSIDFGSPAHVYYTSLSGVGAADALWYDTDGAAQDAAPLGVDSYPFWRAAASDVEAADGENVKIYVDGELMGTNAASQIGDATGWKVGIGANLDTGDRELDGSLDEVRIYDRALSPQEILDYYNFTKPPGKD